MPIDRDLLIQYGADLQAYKSKEFVFREDDLPEYYYQVVEGVVEVINYHHDGRVFMQEVLLSGESIGEALLFTDKRYPITAITRTECIILKISKHNFLQLIQRHPDISLKLLVAISNKIHFKNMMLDSFSSNDTRSRIKTMMDHLKSIYRCGNDTFIVPLTRQQLANLIGLRVETVIRLIKNMEKEKILKIENGKIRY